MEYINLQILLFKINIYDCAFAIISTLIILNMFIIAFLRVYNANNEIILFFFIIKLIICIFIALQLGYLYSVLDFYKYTHPDMHKDIIQFLL